jgi:hypothetical protein
LHHVVGLLGLLCRRTKATHSFWSRESEGSPSLLPYHIEWIYVVDVWAWSPLAMIGVLCGLDGEKAEAPSTPHAILGVGFERPLRFSLRYTEPLTLLFQSSPSWDRNRLSSPLILKLVQLHFPRWLVGETTASILVVVVMRTLLLWIQPRLFVGVGVQLVFGLQESIYL